MNFTYLMQPPRKYTFEMPKLKEWTESYCKGKVLNLFAGKTHLNVDEFYINGICKHFNIIALNNKNNDKIKLRLISKLHKI